MATHDELNQFTWNIVWRLVLKSNDHPIVETKWVFKKELHEQENIIRNKARLVSKGLTNMRVKISMRLLHPLLDLKSFISYLNIHVTKTSNYFRYIFKLIRTLYSLKQALFVWYDRLSAYFIKYRFIEGVATIACLSFKVMKTSLLYKFILMVLFSMLLIWVITISLRI